MRNLAGEVAIVTGASRGIGKGIALELGRAGATVYISGRTMNRGGAPWPGSLVETAEAVTRNGGQGIAVGCDHGDDLQVADLFAQVGRDRGRLDLLVNNVSAFGDTADGYPVDGMPFWQVPASQWDAMHAVGLRSHFIAAALAAPLMLPQRAGLIVNISSAGATGRVFNAAYGARLDAAALKRARSPEFTGRAVVALASDPAVIAKSGRALRVADLADEYGFAE